MIFDLKTGKFLEKKKIGVIIVNEKNGWLQKGDLYVAEDGRELISDFAPRRLSREENRELFEAMKKNAYVKINNI